MKGFRSVLSVVLIAGLIFCMAVVTSAESSQFSDNVTNSITDSSRTDFTPVAENEYLKLFLVKSGEFAGEFCVLNKQDGNIWYSNPQSRFQNTEDGGIAKNDAFSQLKFIVYDGSTRNEEKLNTYIGANKGERVQIKDIKNGVEIIYIFDAQKIAVPLKLTLDGKYLTAKVNTDEIIEQGDIKIISMSVLPYFGCTDTNGKGYMFVPDGSGALIYNNNEKHNHEGYRQAVYGNDITYRTDKKDSFTNQIYLPVFGGENENGTFIGIIEDGAADANIEAYVAGMQNSYNNVYADFTLTAKDTVVIGDPNSSKSVTDKRYDFENRLVNASSVKYAFSESGSGYTGMAKLYREYLNIQNSEKKISDTPEIFLELYGGVKKQESFLGIPVKKLQKLTTVTQAQEIIKGFQSAVSGKVNVNYRYLDTAVLNEKAQNKFSVKRGLGNKKQLDVLKKSLDGSLYLEFDPFTVSKGGNGYNKYLESAKRIGKDAITIPTFKLSTLYVDNSINPISVMTADTVCSIWEKYSASVEKKKFKISLNTLPSMLYTDFSAKAFVSRSEMLKTVDKTITANTPGMLESPNAYLLDTKCILTSIPSSDSGFSIEDANVPFYQLVISGTREYSIESVNLSDNIRAQFLKAVETGASLQFSFVYQNATRLRGTRLAGLYGADYTIWKSQAEEMQNEIETVFEKIGSRVLESNTILGDGIYCSVFDSGKGVIVNYTDKAFETEYGKVEANGYLVF